MDVDDDRPGNYLVFDGGLSGLPGLYTLEELLSRLQFDLKLSDEIHPWRHFKVIIGSGRGGLVAIFVGKMKMTASEAIEAYTRLVLPAGTATDDPRVDPCHALLVPALSAAPAKDEEERRRNTDSFRAAFSEILFDAGYDAETPFLDEDGPKTIVCTLNTANSSAVHLVRSYRTRSAQGWACTILEAACACVASSDTFLPVTIGTGHKRVMLIDATTGFANPSQELLREAQRVLGGDDEVATLVSIGAGKGDVWSLSEGFGEMERLKALQRIMMNCEPAHEELWGRLRETGIYYRLNIERGFDSQMQLSSEHISAYLQEGEISDKLDNAIKKIQQRTDGVKLKDINSVTVLEIRLKPRPLLVQDFIGREDILQAMHRTHTSNRSSSLRTPAITVLSGLGGSGKTQIALRFALDFEGLYPDAPVYFLNAESEESLKADYETLIRSQGTEHRSKSYHDALTWLAISLKNWLIILDNADNPSLRLFSYVPKCAFGNVMITTRNSNHTSLAPKSSHHIEGLSESDSIALVLKSSGYENTLPNQALALDIVRELGNLPLALAQAAGYIFVNKSLSSYLSTYRKSTVKVLTSSSSQRLDDYPLSVATTIEMSLNRLPQAAQEVLRIFAHLDSTSIPHGIITKGGERQFEYVTWTENSEMDPETLEHATALRAIFNKDGEWSEFEFNALITQCLQYSLLQITTRADLNFYSIHVLVRSYLKASSTLIQGHRPSQLVVRLLGSSITYSTNYEYLTFNRLLLPHLRLIRLGDVTEAGDHFAFGHVFYETGDGNLALAHQEICVETWRATRRDEHGSTLRAMTDLANSYVMVERNQDALELEEQVLRLRRMLSGPEHPETMKAMHNVADSYRTIGRKEEAMEMEKEVLETEKRILGSEDPTILATMNNLAISYSGLGRTQDALKLREQVLEMRKKALGPEHPDTLSSMYNLALSYKEVGRFEEALKLEEQVVDLSGKVLGPEHPDTVDAMWNLACTMEVLALKARLLELLRTAMPEFKRVWGVNHADTITAEDWLKTLELEMDESETSTRAHPSARQSTLSRIISRLLHRL